MQRQHLSQSICRSADASALGFASVSAGLEVAAKSSSPEQTTLNAEFRGLDLSKHTSRNVDELEITNGDLVFCMTPVQLRKISVDNRFDEAQISLLGLFSESPTPYIPDPYQASNEYFQRCFQLIDEGIIRALSMKSHNRVGAVHEIS